MEKIRAAIVLEILGKPKEHVQEAMETILSRMGAEKGLKILEKKIHQPVHVEKSKDLFTTFSELELEFETTQHFLSAMFAYMPSHVEVISPEKIVITNAMLNDLGNSLVQRLHNYDAVVKKALSDQEFLTRKLNETATHLFKKNQSEKVSKEKESKE